LDQVQVDEDRFQLEKPFTVEDVNFTVFQMKYSNTPGPDGLTIEFYQHFGLICDELFVS
jgi:hypothetical protein